MLDTFSWQNLEFHAAHRSVGSAVSLTSRLDKRQRPHERCQRLRHLLLPASAGVVLIHDGDHISSTKG